MASPDMALPERTPSRAPETVSAAGSARRAGPRPALRVARDAGARETSSFAELYERYQPRVYAFCLKRTGNAAEAEDLTQETFLQLFRALDSFEGRSSLLTFIFGIAQNLCFRHFRQSARWAPGHCDDSLLDSRPVEPQAERRIDAARALARCDEVLEASRQPAHREIFRLRYAERRSIRAIAQRLGRTDASVKVSLRRSRLALASGVAEVGAVLGLGRSGR